MRGRSTVTQQVLRWALFALLAGFGALAYAQSADHGAQDKPAGSDWVSQTAQTCASCHGQKGVSQTANFPILAGQYQDYLLHSLKGYRDGARENAIMAGQVQGMTNDQLEALASYYSRQQARLYTPSMD